MKLIGPCAIWSLGSSSASKSRKCELEQEIQSTPWGRMVRADPSWGARAPGGHDTQPCGLSSIGLARGHVSGPQQWCPGHHPRAGGEGWHRVTEYAVPRAGRTRRSPAHYHDAPCVPRARAAHDVGDHLACRRRHPIFSRIARAEPCVSLMVATCLILIARFFLMLKFCAQGCQILRLWSAHPFHGRNFWDHGALFAHSMGSNFGPLLDIYQPALRFGASPVGVP